LAARARLSTARFRLNNTPISVSLFLPAKLIIYRENPTKNPSLGNKYRNVLLLLLKYPMGKNPQKLRLQLLLESNSSVMQLQVAL
jgi:hypothetical protein